MNSNEKLMKKDSCIAILKKNGNLIYSVLDKINQIDSITYI